MRFSTICIVVLALCVSVSVLLAAQNTETEDVSTDSKAAQNTETEDVSTDSKTEIILYTEIEGKLEWKHFKQTPPEEDTKEDAEICWFIQYSNWENTFKEIQSDNKCRFMATPKAGTLVVTAAMNPAESWVKPGKKTDALLNHEQRHFDIAHVYARLLQQALANVQGKCNDKKEAASNLQEKIAALYKKYEEKCEEIQKEYDNDTNHGTKKAEQSEWNKKIDKWLETPTEAPSP